MQLTWFTLLFFILSCTFCEAGWPFLRPIGDVSNKLVFKAGNLLLRALSATREKNLFTIDYGYGFNLHFETTAAELQAHLPKHLKPLKIKTLAKDRFSKYLVSMYVAQTDLKGITNGTSIGRADIFTYVTDRDNKKALYFLSAVQEPPPFKGFMLKVYEYISKFFAIDPVDFSLAYEHQNADDISVGNNRFIISKAESQITLPPQDLSKGRKTKFHMDFVLANSQIYRGKYDTKNVNYFNQDFIDAEVTVWNKNSVVVENAEQLHPLCRELAGIESYEGETAPIRWYFEVA